MVFSGFKIGFSTLISRLSQKPSLNRHLRARPALPFGRENGDLPNQITIPIREIPDPRPARPFGRVRFTSSGMTVFFLLSQPFSE